VFEAVVIVWIMEFTYTSFFEEYVYACIIMFKVIKMLLDVLLSATVKESLVFSPLLVGFEVRLN